MRVVSWNMGCGPPSRYRSTHPGAWQYLLDELYPDVALVQEALISADEYVCTHGALVWSIDRGKDSGAALFVRKGLEFDPREYSLQGSYIAGASLRLADGPLLIASIHVGPPEYRKHLEALQHWLAEHLPPTTRSIFGGDLNSARKYSTWDQKYLNGLGSLGYFDCHWSLHGHERQTFWGHQAKAGYQDDHLFTTSDLKRLVRACDVIDNPKTRELSDHGPLVLSLEESRG